MTDRPNDHPLPAGYLRDLGTFLARLRTNGIEIGDQQESSVFRLFAYLSAKGEEPRTVGEFASIITPVLAGTPRQQQVCHEAARDVFGPSGGSETPVPPLDKIPQRKGMIARLAGRSPAAMIAASVLVVAVLALGAIFLNRQDAAGSADDVTTDRGVPRGSLKSLEWIQNIKIEELEPPEQSWQNRTARWYYTEYDPPKWMALLGPWLVYALILGALIWAMVAHLRREKASRNITELPFNFRGDRPSFGDRNLTGDLQPLRKVPWVSLPEFDEIASVDATVHAGGLPTAVFRDRVVPLEFVTLVDKRSPRDHFAAFGNVFFQSLQSAGIRTERFFFDTSPTILMDSRTGGSERLDVVLNRSPGAAVLIFLTEDEIIDPISGRCRDWVTEIAAHGPTFLFVPETQAAQPDLIALMPEGAKVLPASPDGLRRLVSLLSGARASPELQTALHPLDALFARLCERRTRWMKSTPLPRPEREELIAALRKSAGADGLQWIAATSVYPELRWPMSLRLRDRLGLGASRPAQIDSDVLRVVQLPWFRFGYMPQWLRTHLIGELPDTLSETIRKVILNAMGLRSGGKRGARSLGLGRETDDGETDEKVRSDHLLLKYLMAGQILPKSMFTVPRNVARMISRRPIRNAVIAGTVGAAFATFGSYAALSSLPINRCDLWGASLFQPDRIGKGTPGSVVEAGGYYERVIDACDDAMAEHPENDRFKYQFVRALTMRPKLIEDDRQTAIEILRNLEAKEYAAALNELGFHHDQETPLELDRDYIKAADYFRRAADAGAIEALSNLADAYEKMGSEYFDLRKEILEEHLQSEGVFLGHYWESYKDGLYGFDKEPVEYIRLVRLGAEREDGESTARLGSLFQDGQIGCDGPPDCHLRIANGHYRDAIRLSGSQLAGQRLAYNYYRGDGFDAQNRDKAFYWAVFAARQGSVVAAELIIQLVGEAMRDGDQKTLEDWGVTEALILDALEKAGDSNPTEIFLTGKYWESVGQLEKARELYRRAAEADYAPAQRALDVLEGL